MPKNKAEDDDIDSNLPKWRVKYIMRPESWLRFSWEIFVAIVLLFLGFLIPYLSAFDNNEISLNEGVDMLSLSVFSLDIFLTMNTAYYDRGRIIRDRLKIFRHYLGFWFWVDAFSTFPFDWFISSAGNGNDTKLFSFFKFIRVLKLFKLVRLVKLRMLIFRIEDQIANETLITFITVMKLLLYLFLIAHFFACTMFSISSLEMSPDSFINLIVNKSDKPIVDSGELYVSSLYWAFVTMASIGYGDFSPRSTNEKMFGVFTMLFSSVVFGVIIGNIGTLMEKYNMKAKARGDALRNTNLFLQKHKITSELRYKARRYIDYAFHYEKYNESNIGELLSLLSQPLQEEILLCTNGNILHHCKIFQIFTDSSINRLAKLLSVKIFSPLDPIIKEGQVPEGMYFILKGGAEVFDYTTSCKIVTLSSREYFGEIGLFARQPCVSSIVSHNFSENLFLAILDFDNLVNLIPSIKLTIDEIRKSCSEGNYSVIHIKCYSCRQLGHIAKNCQVILNDEVLKDNWINRQNRSRLVNLNDPIKCKKNRNVRVVKRYDYGAKNVLGKRRKVGEMYPRISKIVNHIKSYFQENIRDVEGNEVLHTEESILQSSLFQNMTRVKMVLSSSDEDPNESIEEELIREKKFCAFNAGYSKI
ncbi:hypothetical protein SteCoe_1398 [Stentor coeruleus]|uniref:Cyclic nucleotide-binding domain-containing protein n=1 Tax=Stentor coeruleus TaxID=5963 RepID=A0A1R2D1P9_9CILI|nr:hypothetical protein SteCoe_1398 [Stentor coeruleus]